LAYNAFETAGDDFMGVFARFLGGILGGIVSIGILTSIVYWIIRRLRPSLKNPLGVSCVIAVLVAVAITFLNKKADADTILVYVISALCDFWILSGIFGKKSAEDQGDSQKPIEEKGHHGVRQGIFCMSCGQHYTPTDVFCRYCGASLRDEPIAQTSQHRDLMEAAPNPIFPAAASSTKPKKGTYWLPIPSMLIGITYSLSLFEQSEWDAVTNRGSALLCVIGLTLGIISVARQVKGKAMAIVGIALCSVGLLGFIVRLS
jgi:hypothetical protein